jgi:hypothetical protein
MQPPFPGICGNVGKGQIRVSAQIDGQLEALIAGAHPGATDWGSCIPGADMAITVRGNADLVESISAEYFCPADDG